MTLPTDPQEIFNRVCAHLVGMKERSMRATIKCAYRGDNGAKCAIGCLIPDDKYNSDIEAIDLSILCNKFFPEWKDHECLLDNLRKIHDNFRNWNENGFIGYDRLRKIGTRYHLRIPECIKE